MNDSRFWDLISRIDREALAEGSARRAVLPLRLEFAKLPRAELEGFQEQLPHKLFALDGPAFASVNGESGESADGFLYARCFVVARGRSFYESVLANP